MNKQLTSEEAIKGWEYFWSNTQVLRFEIGPDGEKRAIRSNEQRIMPKNRDFDFRKKRRKK